MSRIVLIDGDIVVYQNAFRAQTSFEFDEGELISHANTDMAKAEADDQIARLREELDADRVVVCLTDPEENFRRQWWPEYKVQRRKTHRPLAWASTRQHLLDTYECLVRPGLEADDVMGILATGDIRKFKGEKIICSTDKDMRTIPGLLFNWERPDEGVVQVSETEADFAFATQVLTGDSTDNYPGCPGIGPVRAERILDAAEDGLWPAIVAAFEKKGLTEDDALVQARCARILRSEDYDFQKKEVIPWTPNSR